MSQARKRGPVDRFIDGIEVAAAGFLAAVTVLTFVAVSARYLLNYGILDAHDFSRLLLGILIFWGIAAASYRGDHITVDLFWSWAGPRTRRAIDLFASIFSLVCMAAFTWMMARKYIANWLYFVLADSVAIYLNWRIGYEGYAALNAMYLVLSVVGFGRWNAQLKRQRGQGLIA